jgi:hypothetical protein
MNKRKNRWWPHKYTKHDDSNRKSGVFRGWITYSIQENGRYMCHLILENGAPMYSCECEDSKDAQAMLWDDNEKNRAEWKNAGIRLHILGKVPEEDLPQRIFNNNSKDAYLVFLKTYFPHYISISPVAIVDVE